MARYAQIEDPINETERIYTAQLTRNVMNTLGQVAAERALGIIQGPATPDDALLNRIGALPPSLQAAAQAYAGQLGNQLPPSGSPNGNLARGSANSVRTGVQQPSQTQAVRLGTESY